MKVYPEKFYKLWWEYLKRSLDYKELCQWLREKRLDSTLPLPDKFVIDREKKKPKPIYRTLMFNGDIHSFPFEDWYAHKKNKFKLTQESRKKNALFEYGEFIAKDFRQGVKELTLFLEREPTINELQRYYDEGGYYGRDLNQVYVFFNSGIDDILPAVKEKFKKNLVGEKKIKKIRLDEMERYLRVYDLHISGKKKANEIARIIYPAEAKERELTLSLKRKPTAKEMRKLYNDSDQLSSLRKDVRLAKKIIKNAEENIFPGKYS